MLILVYKDLHSTNVSLYKLDVDPRLVAYLFAYSYQTQVASIESLYDELFISMSIAETWKAAWT